MDSSNLEAFELPECWKDNVRMTALFALPRNESLNPHDWAGKFKFWKELIVQWAIAHRKLTFDVEDLKPVFCRNGKYPASLNKVLEEMEKQGDIISEHKYRYQTNHTDLSWTAWGVNLVQSSVAWSWNKVISSLTEKAESIPRYVVLNVLKNKCEQVLQLPLASSEEIIELEELTDLHPELFPNPDEVELILSQLKRMGKVAIEESPDRTMVKFIVPVVKAKQSQLNNSGWKPSPAKPKEKSAEITEVDRSLATLKRTEKLLNDEIDNIETEMSRLEQVARSRIKEGSRQAAKAALYRRKQLQAALEKRNQALINIQTMKFQLTQAKTDSKVMEAYKIGLSALKNSFGDLPLNEEKIQDTLIELESVLEQHRDIENILSQSVATEETESDLEEELMNILAESDSLSALESELTLPTVPIDSPAREKVAKRPEDIQTPQLVPE